MSDWAVWDASSRDAKVQFIDWERMGMICVSFSLVADFGLSRMRDALTFVTQRAQVGTIPCKCRV
jgi:hypothetical protein